MDLDRHVEILTAPTVTVGPVVLDGDQLRMEGQSPVTLGPGVEVESHLREPGVALFLFVAAAAVGAVCGAVGSFGGAVGVACLGVAPALVIGTLGAVALLRRPRLAIEIGDQRTDWPLPTDLPKDEIETLVKRIGRAQGPTGPVQEATLVLQGSMPSDLSPALLTMVERDLSEPLPEVDDPGVMARLANADRAWDVTFPVDETAALMIWGTRCNAIFLLGDVRDPDREAGLEAFIGGLESPPPAAAVARRRKSWTILERLGERTPPVHLPFVTEAELVPRDPEEVGRRVHALFLVSMASQEFLHTGRIEQLAEPLAQAELSPAERAFCDAPSPELAKELAWRMEAVVLLSWALGRVDDPPEIFVAWEPSTPEDQRMAAQAKDGAPGTALRPLSEIADQLDRVYCARWVAVDAALKGVAVGELEPNALLQHHLALCWLTEDVAWDDVRPST